MATETRTPPPAPPSPSPRWRLHPLVLGTLSALVSIAAGAGAAALYLAFEDEPARPEPEVTLRFTGDLDESEAGTGGTQLPDTSFPDLDGNLRSFADYRGTPLVVNFWASSCAPCIREMPDLEQVRQEVGGDVAFLGIAVRDQVADSRRMLEQTGVTYDIGRDPSGALLAELGAVGLPSTVFVAADGSVAHLATGALSLEQIRERVEALRT
jgi:cytochrome c biogenesis protein CcmG, thiol:disulfide interchange protein DsbE